MSVQRVLQRAMIRVLRWFFYLIYEPMAWSYDFVAWAVSLGRWKAWVLSVLPYLSGPNVLELGHGPGHLMLALNRRGRTAIGLDASWQMGCLCLLRGKRVGVRNVCVNGYAQFMPIRSGFFHQVVATFPSEYLWDPRTLAEVRRVLAPGGQLVTLPIAWLTGSSRLERFLRLIYRLTGQAPAPDDPTAVESLAKILRTAGFQVEILRSAAVADSTLLIILASPTGER
jgi:ubiquinone/menaquinone biosynthesis C-methylase UbiE